MVTMNACVNHSSMTGVKPSRMVKLSRNDNISMLQDKSSAWAWMQSRAGLNPHSQRQEAPPKGVRESSFDLKVTEGRLIPGSGWKSVPCRKAARGKNYVQWTTLAISDCGNPNRILAERGKPRRCKDKGWKGTNPLGLKPSSLTSLV